MMDGPRPRIDHEIDACRPGSDDLQQPEFAALVERLADDAQTQQLFQRSQAFDAAVVNALHDVPVPLGLAERILAALEPATPEPASQMPTPGLGPLGSLPGAADQETAGRVVDIPGPIRWKRPTRRTLLHSLIVSGAIAGGIFWACWLIGRPAYTVDQIVPMALSWVESRVEEAAWQPIPPQQTQEVAYRIPLALLAIPRRFQEIRTELARQSLVYDLGRNRPAYLFVVSSGYDPGSLPRLPPLRPQHQTGRWLVAVWQDSQQRQAYILAFQGSVHRYGELVRTSSGLAQSRVQATPIP